MSSRGEPDPGWLFLWIFGGLPAGLVCLGLDGWTGFWVGFVLITYYWWPSWVQRARYGPRKKHPQYIRREKGPRLTRAEHRSYPYSPEEAKRMKAARRAAWAHSVTRRIGRRT
jgi:hypothetical protein